MMTGEQSNDPISTGVGKFIGEHALLPVLDLLSRRVEQFNIQCVGLDNLSQVPDQPYLFASNHLKPKRAMAEQSQLSPDAFVIQRVVKETTGVSPRIIAKAGDGWWSQKSWYRTFQEKSLPAIRVAELAAGLIPVNKNPGLLNREFLELSEQAVKNGDSMLIFPEGYWYPDFSPEHSLDSGAAFLALKLAIPIIPVYIHGADDWKKGQEVYISFGKPFKPFGEGKNGRLQTTEAIRLAIAELQNHFV